ncbi:MAG TPA: hypothetical protein VEC17_02075 [Candidatus Binatia bacterium]|nr:hypothetical protein [Candidatus Binatia bacterium]
MGKTKKFVAFLGVFALALAASPVAFAIHSPTDYSLFGEASYITPGNASNRAVRLVSDSDPGFAGIDYGVESGLTFAELTTLSTDYRFEADDSCGGGSPRFQVNVVDPTTGDEGSIFVYIGPPPAYTGCPPAVWTNTGDLLEGVNPIDTSQLTGGMFYDPYGAAVLKYGDYEVTGIQLVADGGWFFLDGEQTVDIDNTLINTTLFTYEPSAQEGKELCKNGGWRLLVDDNGNGFKNQGDCVSYFASGGKNKGSN